MVFSIVGAGFWEKLQRSGLARGREPEDCGGFRKVKGAYIYLLTLGTERVGVAWLTWVMDGKVGSGCFLGLRQGHQLDGHCCPPQGLARGLLSLRL